jgi:hypothetical protein
MDRAAVQSRQNADLRSVRNGSKSSPAATMSGQELVDRFIAAGRNIFAQTDVAADIQADILAGIALVVEAAAGVAASANGVPQAHTGTARLAAMTLRERRMFLARRYRDRTPWAAVRPRKPQEPTPEDFRRWADDNFPDRLELGLVLSDLSVLDKEAYGKLRHWANRRDAAAKIDPAAFGFPSKVVHYDPLKPVPTGAELFRAVERGDPRAAELRRDYMRARYHLQRDN